MYFDPLDNYLSESFACIVFGSTMVVFLKAVLLENLQEPDTQPETADARVQPETYADRIEAEAEADRIEDEVDDLTFRSETEDGVDDAKVRHRRHLRFHSEKSETDKERPKPANKRLRKGKIERVP